MKVALALLALMAVAYVCDAAMYGDACTASKDPVKDDAACSGANNNMLCNPSSNSCECKDKYPGMSDGKAYKAAGDKKGCTAS